MSTQDSAGVREHLLAALEADLIGPFAGKGSTAEEVLELPPSRWYLTGFLAPERSRAEDPSSDDQLGTGPDEDDDVPSGPEPEIKQRPRYPASIGLSVLLPPASETSTDVLHVEVRFAEYRDVERVEDGADKTRRRVDWHRVARPAVTVELPLSRSAHADVPLPNTPLVHIVSRIERADAPGLRAGARALSLFLVNRRTPEGDRRAGRDFLFQVELALRYEPGFLPRPNRQGENAEDWDDRVADLQFRERCEYAVGHGISAEIPEGQGERITRVQTTWLPRQEVRRVVTREDSPAETKMEALASLPDGTAARACLLPLVESYGAWLKQQALVAIDGDARKQTQRALLQKAEHARQRIVSGLERLAREPDVLEAFRLTNFAMASSALQRSPSRYNETQRPEWRLFQLAFLLLNLDGIAEPTHEDREQVDLIFFPTGGGKTEAYLGVIAFTLLLRRIRGQARPDRGLGVAVLLRYTLRLLTLDQLGRAATLVCALEALRKADPTRLGQERFTVGLWVGKSATANTLNELKRQVLDYKNNPSVGATSPFPLTNCPWCNAPLGKDSLTLVPSATKTESIVVGCSNFRCEYAAAKNRSGLPVLFVDDQIYRELPCFLIATVDKFAMLPWRAETGMLFGRAMATDGERFYGPSDAAPKRATALPEGLLPPELIVQDELHLISGPLGTMVGLYETAIDALSTRARGAASVRPKVLASTATVRRAREQIRALFARDMLLFPPPGVDDAETWFAGVGTKKPGRLYVGVAAPGRSLKGILLRSYVDLLAAAERAYAAHGVAGDPYMTVAGYFNALRELGGMRRLVEDEALQRCRRIEQRRPLNAAPGNPWFKNRALRFEPVELTSRETTAKIKDAKDRLSHPHSHEQHVDVLLASNMISVGVDIDRLGLMVIAGQPKTTAEYIQASSRVGRQHPGLVVTVFNTMKPRDRSHYERFSAYHASFYRYVEATSVTPFSGPALTRGLAGTLVAMTRLGDAQLTPPEGAMRIARHREGLGSAVVRALGERAGQHRDFDDAAEHERLVQSVRRRAQTLLDDWEKLVRSAQDEGAAQRQYSPFDRDPSAGRALLSTAIDDPSTLTDLEQQFIVPTSMRDVEESVHLWLERRVLGGKNA